MKFCQIFAPRQIVINFNLANLACTRAFVIQTEKRLRADTCDYRCVTNPGLSQIEILSKDQLRLLSTTINIHTILERVRIRVHLSFLKEMMLLFLLGW